MRCGLAVAVEYDVAGQQERTPLGKLQPASLAATYRFLPKRSLLPDVKVGCNRVMNSPSTDQILNPSTQCLGGVRDPPFWHVCPGHGLPWCPLVACNMVMCSRPVCLVPAQANQLVCHLIAMLCAAPDLLSQVKSQVGCRVWRVAASLRVAHVAPAAS